MALGISLSDSLTQFAKIYKDICVSYTVSHSELWLRISLIKKIKWHILFCPHLWNIKLRTKEANEQNLFYADKIMAATREGKGKGEDGLGEDRGAHTFPVGTHCSALCCTINLHN